MGEEGKEIVRIQEKELKEGESSQGFEGGTWEEVCCMEGGGVWSLENKQSD